MTSGMFSTIFSILSEASLQSSLFFIRSLIIPMVLSCRFIVAVCKSYEQTAALMLLLNLFSFKVLRARDCFVQQEDDKINSCD